MATENPYLGQQNPYLQQIIDMSSKDLVDNYGRTTLPASNAAMVRSGSFGNSGLQEMERANADVLQGNLGDLASKLRFNDYTQQQDMFKYQNNFDEGQRQFDEGTRRWDLGFDRDVFNDGYSQSMGNLQAGVGLLGTLNGYNAQDINNTTTQQNTPLNYLQQFSRIASGIGGMGNTSTSTQGTSSNPALSALGGAQLGNSWWNSSNRPSGGGNISQPNQDAFQSFGDSNGWWGTS